MNETAQWYVYILICKDSSFYCGIAKDVHKRFEQHQNGKGARYTRGRGPLTLVWQLNDAVSHSEALRLERLIKSLSRAEKALLIQDNIV